MVFVELFGAPGAGKSTLTTAATPLDGSVPAATLVDRLVDGLDAADSGD